MRLVGSSQQEKAELATSLDELARQGARRMLREALEHEVADYVARNLAERSEDGRALVTRNGKARPRKVTLGAGTVEVTAPRVRDQREGERFSSKILPPYLRRSANVESLLPVLYLKGLSGNAFREALGGILGEGVSGLSPSAISALKSSWEREYEAWRKEPISEDIVYIWADGVHVKIRLGEDKRQCLLVIMGATQSGEKKLLAVEPGYRESKESWLEVLRSLKERGMAVPSLAIGDGALGFWGAIAEVYPATEHSRCWVHKIANVLDKLPKRLQGKAKQLLHEMMYADTAAHAEATRDTFARAFRDKQPRAVECLMKDWPELTVHFRYPAAHWRHIRTTNPIESAFATVKLRTRSTKGSGNGTVASTMAFKLLHEAQKRWRRISSPEDLKHLRNGLEYADGIMVTTQLDQEAAAG